LETLFNLEGVNFANEISNDYPVTFDNAYALFVAADGNIKVAKSLCISLSETRSLKHTLCSYYKYKFI
jgi:hypothetical protein